MAVRFSENPMLVLVTACSGACGDPTAEPAGTDATGEAADAASTTGAPKPDSSTTGDTNATTASVDATSTGSSGAATAAYASSSGPSSGSDDTSGDRIDCGEPGAGWPASAAEALERSCVWDPGLQVEHRGAFTSSAEGEIIEDLHIVDGGIFIEHDGVTVRNVTSEGAIDMQGGMPPVTLAEGTSDTELVGVLLGPPAPQWSAACGRPVMPFNGLHAERNASWRMEGAAIRLVPYAISIAEGGEATVVDAFIEMGRAVEPNDAGSCADSRSFGASISGDDASLAMRRTWVDAQPYSMLSADGPVEQVEVTLSDLSMTLRTFGLDVSIDFAEVGMHGGRLAIQLFESGTLSLVDSESNGTLFPFAIQLGEDVIVPQWESNVRDGMPWDPPG